MVAFSSTSPPALPDAVMPTAPLISTCPDDAVVRGRLMQEPPSELIGPPLLTSVDAGVDADDMVLSSLLS